MMKRRGVFRVCVCLAASLAAPAAAEAHIIGTRFGDFYAGALHPLTDLADIATWLAVALVAAASGPQRARWLVPLFPIGLALGFALGVLPATAHLAGTFGGRTSLALCLTLLGLLLALGRRLPTALLCLTGLVVAILRGGANASGAGAETNLALFMGGLAAAAYITLTLGMALAVIFRRCEDQPRNAWRAVTLRAIGGWVGAVGIMMLSFALGHPG